MAIRMTYQTNQVLMVAKSLGHGTNLQILQVVNQGFPELSATTVHRITQRLIQNNFLAYGPEINGSNSIDANTRCHDHFICSNCYKIQDVTLTKEIKNLISSNIGVDTRCKTVTIYGNCSNC